MWSLPGTSGEIEKAASALTLQQQQTSAEVSEVEKLIAKYKAEYALLIAEAERLKEEMKRVQEKLKRSVALLDRL